MKQGWTCKHEECKEAVSCRVEKHARHGGQLNILAEIMTVEPNSKTVIGVKVPRTSFDRIKQIPGASWNNAQERYTLPLTWAACVQLRGTFGEELVIEPELKQWAIKEKTERVIPSMELRTSKTIPPGIIPQYEGEPSLYDYQEPAAQMLITNRFCIEGDDMRVGKTPVAIRALRALHDQGVEVFPTIVVAPPNVKRVWKRELATWWPDAVVEVPKSGLAAAEKAIKSGADIIVLHYEILAMVSNLEGWGSEALKACSQCNPDSNLQVSRCHIHKKALNEIDVKAVIADEVHRVGEPSALMTRALWKISKNANVRFGLTGTMPEEPDRAWSVLHFVFPDEYPVKGKCIDRYANTVINPWTGFKESTDWKQGELKKEWDSFFMPRFIRRPRELVHDVIQPTALLLEPEMTPKQAGAYKALKKSMMAEIDGGLFWVDSPGAKMQRLRQLASAFGETTDGSDFILSEPSNKLDCLEDFLKNLPKDESVAIFAEQAQLIELAYLRLEDQAVKLVGGMSDSASELSEKRFKEGDVPYILCTTASGGEGISLTRANTTVYLQEPYSRKDKKQCDSRFYEENTASMIVIIRTPDTVDVLPSKAMTLKDAKFEDLVKDKETVMEWLS